MSHHTMKSVTKDITKSVRSAWESAHPTYTPKPFKETAVDKALRVAREKLDKAEKHFHEDAKTPLKRAKAAMKKAEACYRKAYLVHEKKMKG